VSCSSTAGSATEASTSASVVAAAGPSIEECPVMGDVARAELAGSTVAVDDAGRYQRNADWWPNRLDLSILRQNSAKSDPMGEGFDYATEFAKVDLDELRADLKKVMTTSQAWWPADWDNYGGLFIRMAWHSAGTYRSTDGRGGSADGMLRFAPLNSWPDNANLDKSRRLLWPIKQKYGRSVSWADLMIFAGNVALEHSGFETLGFAGGREDLWESQQDINWGPEDEWLGVDRWEEGRELEGDLAAAHMGLIYVNPEGPDGNPDPLAAAHDIRVTFGRMAMNDEETAALIAGGHTLGKAHGAAPAGDNVGPDPEAAPIAEQGFGWNNGYGTGNGADTITSGLEGAWTSTPTDWSSEYLENLWNYEWELTKSPAGAQQWTPVGAGDVVPDAHVDGKRNKVMMLTTDLSLREDPIYAEITKRWLESPGEFDKAFAAAWFKLTHRDMGPPSRLLGDEVPPAQLWQDPIPAVDHPLIDGGQQQRLKAAILSSGIAPRDLVAVAWASASTYRDSDKRGGANGARIRLAPQNGWEVNEPETLAKVLAMYEQLQAKVNAAGGDKKVSLADLIVLGGCAGLEAAAASAGATIEVPFTPGRMDASEEMTDSASFDVLEPKADGFRNYFSDRAYLKPSEALIDRANQLTLTVPEMTVLVGGLRAVGVTAAGSKAGILTDTPGHLDNAFFVNLLDMNTKWEADADGSDSFVGSVRATGAPQWFATSVDLIFGSNSELRAVSEVYGTGDGAEKFLVDFVAAWDKVMNLDRFGVK
jgi:catalase-peroxidase